MGNNTKTSNPMPRPHPCNMGVHKFGGYVDENTQRLQQQESMQGQE
eukprot:CAMPEP_0169146262 /NCGR_PEP_ID=MMETSP1015-20121227/47439_1 /TAXON_ID=342587 /ORGANISM="Karlodinium micrum, Strain CCMP2283" /LENGTH=45 /DNA_ID= /DNA_START= /DNA_END= /DNA_ORIENTATION=